MKDIKFRAWDKSSKTWTYLFLLPEGQVQFKYESPNKGELSNWLQYTGLKDRNGKEIYEGDIVKDTYPAGYRTYQVKFGEYDNGEDYEDNVSGNGWYLQSIFEHYYVEKWKDKAYDKFDYSIIEVMRVYEVIGNIYKNPELLK